MRSWFVVRCFEGVLRGWRARWVVCGVKVREARVQGGFRLCLWCVVLRGFCGGAIFLLSWMCPWLVARLWGACFLAGWAVRVVFSYAFSRE